MNATIIKSTVDSHCHTSLCDPWCSAALTRPSGRFQTPARLFVSPAPSPIKTEWHDWSVWGKKIVSHLQQSEQRKWGKSHLHGGDRCLLFKFLLARCRSALSGGFTGQQGELAVAVVHQVQNGVLTCFTWILQSSTTNLSTSLCHEALPTVQSSFNL